MLNRSSIFAFAAIAALGTAGAIPSSAFAGLFSKAARGGAEAEVVGKAARGGAEAAEAAEARKALRDYLRDKALEEGAKHGNKSRDSEDDSH